MALIATLLGAVLLHPQSASGALTYQGKSTLNVVDSSAWPPESVFVTFSTGVGTIDTEHYVGPGAVLIWPVELYQNNGSTVWVDSGQAKLKLPSDSIGADFTPVATFHWVDANGFRSMEVVNLTASVPQIAAGVMGQDSSAIDSSGLGTWMANNLGASGATDWTSGEKEQIRWQLGLDGTQTNPSAGDTIGVHAILDSLRSQDAWVATQAALTSVGVDAGTAATKSGNVLDSIQAWDNANGVSHDVQAILDSLRSQDNWVALYSMQTSMNADIQNLNGWNPATTEVLANVTQVSGSAGAADSLEAMLTGTGRTLSLSKLSVAGGADTGVSIAGGAAYPGMVVQGGVSGNAGAVFQGTGSNGPGIYASGAGTGDGLYAQGGATGAGIQATGQGTNHGISAVGGGTNGSGIYGEAGGTGSGLYVFGGSGNGNGLKAEGFGTGDGMQALGGASGDGFMANSSTGPGFVGGIDTVYDTVASRAVASVNQADIKEAVWGSDFDSLTTALSTGGAVIDSAGDWGRTAAGASGAGAYACSTYVHDGVNPIGAGVVVWAYPNGGGTPLKNTTDANGFAKFSLDADTFLVYAWTAGYTQTTVPETLEVAGAIAGNTLQMDAVASGSPSSPALTLVSFVFYDAEGSPIKEVPLSFELEPMGGSDMHHLDSLKSVVPKRKGTARSDSTGKVAIDVVPNDSIVVNGNEVGTTRYRVRAWDPTSGLPLLGESGILLNVTASATEKRYPRDFPNR